MDSALSALFWVCVALILYVYFGYPLLLVSGLLGQRRPIRRETCWPTVSFIVPAYNEEKTIRSKIENLRSLDYPQQKIEILIGDDGSTDQTAAIIETYRERNVIPVNTGARCGKSAIQNEMVARAKGSILVFTDADCLLPQDALQVMLPNFGEHSVGLVTNHVSYLNQEETSVVESEGLYLRYERWIRKQESDRGLLALASGSLFAMRREFWKPLDPNLGDDFVLPLWVVQKGARNILEPGVSAATRLTQNRMYSLLRWKIRIISKDLRGLIQNYACLNPLRFGAVAIGLWSHKLLRWLVPYFLLALLVSNAFLVSHRPYSILLGLQVLFYGVALGGVVLGGHRLRFPFSTVSSFCVVNFAALLGTLHCLALRPAGQWRTVR